jgi:lipoic acid synthetase
MNNFNDIRPDFRAKRTPVGGEDGGNSRRKPPWLKVRLPNTAAFQRVRHTLSRCGLHSICQEARCPNITECFQEGTATFLILGKVCTRNCLYCHVSHGVPAGVDPEEPRRLVAAARELCLKYVVVTSVTRDALRRHLPAVKVEVLIPDFQGDFQALAQVIAARPEVINHNVEVAPALFPHLRPQGNYRTSLEILNRIGREGSSVSKSGFMVGCGESMDDIRQLLDDLAAVGCRSVTIGQYLQPTAKHWPVQRYYRPEEFAALREAALSMGFAHVEAGPLVRSSYHAGAGAG